MHLALATLLLISSGGDYSSNADPSTVTGEAAGVEPCGETDLACVLRSLQQRALEVESLTKQLALSKQQYASAQELIEVWRSQAQVARDAAKDAMSSLKPMAWYQSPVLWVSVGLTIGVALAIGIVYALKPAFVTSASP